MEYVDFYMNEHTYNSELTNGTHPYVTQVFKYVVGRGNNSFLRYHFCYYEPTFEVTTIALTKQDKLINTVNSNYLFRFGIVVYGESGIPKQGYNSVLNISVKILESSSQSSFNYFDTKTVKFTNGIGYYQNTMLSTYGEKQNTSVTILFETISATGLMMNMSKQLRITSRTNIIVLLHSRYENAFRNLNNEIQQVATYVKSKHQFFRRHVRVTLKFYQQAIDIYHIFKEHENVDSRSPDCIHGLVAINSYHQLNVFRSVVDMYNIPAITGNTMVNCEILMDQIDKDATGLLEDQKANEVSLDEDKTENEQRQHEDTMENKHGFFEDSRNLMQFYNRLNSTMSVFVKHFREKNWKNIIIIRDTMHLVPASFIYNLIAYDVNVTSDIVLDSTDLQAITKALKQIRHLPSGAIFFFLDFLTSVSVFISSTKLGLSPLHGYQWVSGSPGGVFEEAVSWKACYQLKPISCAEAFKGVMMYPSLDDNSKSAKVKGNTISLDRNSLRSSLSAAHSVLLKFMVLDGLESILDTILTTISRNQTVFTKNVVEIVKHRELPRMVDFDLCTSCTRSGKQSLTLLKTPCAKGWSGFNCNIPHCSNSSCNLYNGKCVGHETCECFPGFYAFDCSQHCKYSCIHGVCNDGSSGDGKCETCDWLYTGEYCNEPTIIKALCASAFGLCALMISVTFYWMKHYKSKEGDLLNVEKEDSKHLLEWESLSNLEKVLFKSRITLEHLSEKKKYTKYFQGRFKEKEVFVKSIEKPPVKFSVSIRGELRKAIKLDHLNIEKVIGVILGPPYTAVVTEYAGMGSLYDVLHEEYIEIPWEVKYSILEDICRGMIYLHDHLNLTHGRLKSPNCLLHLGWRVKITDIGLRRFKDRNDAGRIRIVERMDGRAYMRTKKDECEILEDPDYRGKT